jgi:hypothetical protein
MPEPSPLARLFGDGLLTRDDAAARTTARWQGAMARAALRLQVERAPWGDLRLPIAMALVELYGSLPDEELASYVEAVLPIEERELAPLLGASSP